MPNLLFWRFDDNKCKIALRAAAQRIKLLVNKKTVLVQNAKREIANLLKERKEEKAKIKVEFVIREDMNIEALEIMDLICELLQQRIELIKVEEKCPQDLVEQINTLIWACPRLNIEELNNAKEQFRKKYGNEFVEAAESAEGHFQRPTGSTYPPIGQMEPVQIQAPQGATIHVHNNSVLENGRVVPAKQKAVINQRVVSKLSILPPPEELIINYLTTIADHFGIDYTPSDGPSQLDLGHSVPIAQGSGFTAAYTVLGSDSANNNNNNSNDFNNMGGGNGFGGGNPYQPTVSQPLPPSEPYPSQTPQPLEGFPTINNDNNNNRPNVNLNHTAPVHPPTTDNQALPALNNNNLNLPTATLLNSEETKNDQNGDGNNNDGGGATLDDLYARMRELKK